MHEREQRRPDRRIGRRGGWFEGLVLSEAFLNFFRSREIAGHGRYLG